MCMEKKKREKGRKIYTIQTVEIECIRKEKKKKLCAVMG